MADETLNNLDQALPPDVSAEVAAIPEIEDIPEVEEILDTEPPVPPLTLADEINQMSEQVLAEEAPYMDFNYQQGKTKEFSAKQANFEKYYSYGSEIYGKYGFNPFLPGVDTDGDGLIDKSGMDNLYDENTDYWDDRERSYTGMWELAKIGWSDTFMFGAWHDDENYKSFGDTMNKYSSSKKDTGAFINNTRLSAGYTIGIIGAIAAEEAALALTTWGAGNLGTAAASTTRLGKAFQKMGSWMNKNKLLKVVDDLGDINKTRKWFDRRVTAFGKGLKGFGKAINPIGETMGFIRNADRLGEFTKLQAVATGAASVTRDMRKIYLAHSEGKLEADMAEEEFRTNAWDDWYDANPDAGLIPDEQIDIINSEALRVNANVYAGNFGLIYLTNAVTFNSLFRSGKSVRRLAQTSANGLFKITRNSTTKKAMVEAVVQNSIGYARKTVRNWSYLGTAKSSVLATVRNSMEGVQELGQDVLSESFKNYHLRNTLGTQTKGGFMHYLDNDLINAVKKQNSHEGLVTFGSGLFMGAFASPVSFANTQLTKFLGGGAYISAAGTYEKIFNKDQYKKKQEQNQKKLEEKAKMLTEFFNENKTFIKANSMSVYRQVELEQEMLDAAQTGHTQQFKNSQHESLVNGAKTLLENGLIDEYIQQLEYFGSDQFTTEDLQELFERPDITDATAQEFRDKLLSNAKTLGEIKEANAIIQAALPNPHHLSRLKTTDANYSEVLYKHYAWKDLQQELLFNSAKIADRKKRLTSIKKLIGETNELAAELSVDALVDETSLDDTIKLLKAEVEANKDLDLTGEASVQALTSEKRLAALEKYSDAFLAYSVAFDLTKTLAKTGQNISNKSESEYYDEFFEAYNNVLKEYGLNKLTNVAAQTELNEQAFDLIFDYITIEAATGEYTRYVKTLETANGQNEFLRAREQVIKRLDENKEVHILNALQAFSEKTTSDQMLKELYDLGFFFELNSLDSLMRDGIMPLEILDLNNNNEPVSDKQYMIAQAIMQKHVEKLTGKKLIRDKFEQKSQGRKLLSDKRTVDDILNEYGIVLNKNLKINDKDGARLLEQILGPKNKNLTKLDREILIKVIEGNDVTLKFVSDQTLPIQINDAGVITIDIRYAGEDYMNSAYSIENLITTALTQSKITSQLKENDDLWLQTRMAMKQAKDAYAKAYPEENVDEMAVFNNVDVFLSESLNDVGFQEMLAQMVDNVAPAKKSLWSTVKKGTVEILTKDFEGKLLNRVINIAAKAIDDTIVDNISEINIKARTEEDSVALDKKTADLKVMAEELSLKWNVKVKILRDQNEAQKFIDQVENPFYEKEDGIPAGFYDEKTNTAYIIAEDVKGNTAMHEIFLHPFLINAEKSNPELYKALIAEAKADKTVVDYVEKQYGKESIIGTRQFEHELVGRVYSLALDNKISEKDKPGLFKRAYEFMKALLKATGEYLKILPKDISKFKPGKTTIADLAKYSQSQRSGFDLGAVVLEPVRPEPKVDQEKIKVTKTITKETQENTGGNTIVVKEARDYKNGRGTALNDFINDDIQFENADSVNAATDELVALGKELDELDVLADESNWKFGDLRFEVDGRLVIDVIANGKRFLMYKSTGTGTTADTAGEWTPLLYFGTMLKTDGSGRKEWFVKSIFEGQDPKKNKYGIKTFIGLDSLLKAQEAELFSGSENIVTRTETEEVEVEEKPVPKQEIEESLEADDTLETVINKIENLEGQLNKQETLRQSGKLNVLEKSRVRRKITGLKLLINELEEKRKELVEANEKEGNSLKVKEVGQWQPSIDYNGNEIIVPGMPFSRLPESLQLSLAELYGKKLGSLNAEDIEKIKKERYLNPVYISVVNDYVEKRLERQNKVLGEQEVLINQAKVDSAKEKRQAELNSRKKGGKIKQTLQEKIEEIATIDGKLFLTKKEIEKLAGEVRNQTGNLPFGFEDVRAYVMNKKRIADKKQKKKDTIQYAKDLIIERAKEAVIKKNIKRLGTKGKYNAFSVKSINAKTGQKEYKRNDLVIPAGMRDFLLKYHPDLFILEDVEMFNAKLLVLIKQYKYDIKSAGVANVQELKDLVEGTEEEVLKKLGTLVNKLEKDKLLYPVIVKRINAALNEANIDITLKRLSGARLQNDASLYGLYRTPNKIKGKKVFSPKKGRFTQNKALIDNFEYTLDFEILGLEQMAEVYFASLLLEPGVFLPRSVFTSIDVQATAAGKYDSMISEDPNTWLFGISENASYTALGDQLIESLAGSLNISVEQLNTFLAGQGSSGTAGITEVYNVLADNFTKKSIVAYYGGLIKTNSNEFFDDENMLVPEDMQSLVEYVKWSTTEEGKKYIAEELLLLDKDKVAFDELYVEEQTVQDEEEEKPTKNIAYDYFEKNVADQLVKAKTVGQQLNILWDLLNKELEGDLNYVKAYAAYAKDLNMTQKQRDVSNALIDAQFSSGLAIGAVINLNGVAYIINDYLEENNKVQISLLESEEATITGYVEYLEFGPQSLLSQMTEELKAGSIFNGQVIDTVVNTAEIEYIKEAYSNILTNFTMYNKEAESLSDEQLLEDLKTELTKCK